MINPILLALVITITVLPIPGKLTRRGMPGWLALVLTILVVVLLLALVILTVFFSVTKLATELPTYMAEATQQAAADSGVETSTYDYRANHPAWPGCSRGDIGRPELVGPVWYALVIFFFMISAAMALPGAVRLGLDPNAPTIGRITHLTTDIRHYMSILTGINFLVGLGDTVFLLYLGVDYALLWGLLAWFMGYIPSIGFMIALVSPVLMAYAQYGLQTALVVLVWVYFDQRRGAKFHPTQADGPGIKISPVVVFVGLFVWGFLLGGIGAIVAVPMSLLVLIIMENFEGTRIVAVLMRYTVRKRKRKEGGDTR